MKLEKPEKRHLIIVAYALILLVLSIPIKNLLADAWVSSPGLKGLLYELERETGKPVVERWKRLEVLVLGIFWGMLAATSWLDYKKRLQGVLLLLASSIVVLAYVSYLLPRSAFLLVGAVAGALITYVRSEKVTKTYRKCEFGTKIIYWIGSLAVGIALLSVIAHNYALNRDFGFIIEMPYLMYLISSVAFVKVLKKFTDYEVSSTKVMVVGPYRVGKTVFMGACYDYAVGEDLVAEFPTPDLVDVHRHLTQSNAAMPECWPPPTPPHAIKEYRFTYTCGTLFVKDVELLAYDYSGELFEEVLRFLRRETEGIGEMPRKIGASILAADQLVFLLDVQDLSGEGETRAALGAYIEIAKNSKKPYYLVATKCDALWDAKWEVSDENYERLRARVMKVLNRYPEFKVLEKRCRGDVMYVLVFTSKDGERRGCPHVREEGRLLSLGYDRVLEVLGGAG